MVNDAVRVAAGDRALVNDAPAGHHPSGFDPSRCANCEGSGWVCENHHDRPWEHTAAPGEGCGCGAGSPCPVCEPDMAFAGRCYAIIEACATIAEMPFDWGPFEAPTTYRQLAQRIAAKIRKLGPAQAIEARRAETRSGSVHESAVGETDAPNTQVETPSDTLGEKA